MSLHSVAVKLDYDPAFGHYRFGVPPHALIASLMNGSKCCVQLRFHRMEEHGVKSSRRAGTWRAYARGELC